METGVSGRDTASNAILEALLKESLGFEKLVEALKGKASRGTVSKYLKELVVSEKMVELAPQKNYGAKPFYQITKMKKERAAEMVEAYRKKQEFGPKFENLFQYATQEELEAITNFLFSVAVRPPKMVHQKRLMEMPHNPAEKAISDFQSPEKEYVIHDILERIKIRRSIGKMQQTNAPIKLLIIGKKMLADEPVTRTEVSEFFMYPIDVQEAVVWVSFDLSCKFNKNVSWDERFEKEDPEYNKILQKRFAEVLNGPVPDNIKEKFIENITRFKTENPAWLEFMKKNANTFGADLAKLLIEA